MNIPLFNFLNFVIPQQENLRNEIQPIKFFQIN